MHHAPFFSVLTLKRPRHARVLGKTVLILMAMTCLCGHLLWAATYYIDPAQGIDSNTGLSTSSPKQHWSAVTWAAGNTYLQKRGTTASEVSFSVTASGTVDHPITLGAYGTGADPILKTPAGQIHQIYMGPNIAYVVIRSLGFTLGSSGSGKRFINISGSHDITIDACSFYSSGVEEAIQVYNSCANQDVYNITISNCRFSNLTNTDDGEGIRFYVGSASRTIYDVRVSACTFSSTNYGIRLMGLESVVGANNTSPYGVIIEDCTFNTIRGCAIATSGGIRNVDGHPSFLRRNTARNIGTDETPHVNAFQLSWCRGLIVEDNLIDTVRTSAPDGHGITLDFAYVNDNYLSDGVIVRRNIVHGCKAGACSAGIKVYKATNCTIYNNYCFDNSNGLTIENPICTGNAYYNNTSVKNLQAGFRAHGQAAVATLKNNIFAFNGLDGITVGNAGTSIPVAAYNCFFNNASHAAYNYITSSAIPPAAGDIFENPGITNTSSETGYALTAGSACIDKGVALNAITDDLTKYARPNNNSLDIGCYEWRLRKPPTSVKVTIVP